MQLSVVLLVVSVVVTMATARSFVSSRDKPAQRRNLTMHEKRRSDYHTKNDLEKSIFDGELSSFGDVQRTNSVTSCVMNIAKTGIKRSFPNCKAYIKEITQFCRSTNGKNTHKNACQRVSISLGIAIDECDVLAEERKPVTELCKTLVPQKKSKANCKAGQLFGQIPGSSTTPVCIDAPQDKQSKTQELPLRMYRPYQRYTAKNSAQIQADFHPKNNYNPKSRTPDTLVEVHTLPIGQGDCTVIYCNGGQHAILFDCGARGGNTLKPEFIQSYFEDVSSITVMISHAHADHYNRIPLVFNHLHLVGKINQIIVGGPEEDYSAKSIKNWLKNLQHKVTYQVASSTYNFCNGVEFEVIVGNGNDPNQRGMVMKMSCTTCKSSLLFTGDMEGNAAEAMAKDNKDILRATHYKMAHHGASDKANKENWLKAISPIEVHISHMYYHRKYGHPSCEAIDLLKGIGTTLNIANTPHDFTCIEKRTEIAEKNQCVKDGKWFVCHNKIQHRIYSTAPTSNEICVIVLSFRKDQEATTDIYCGERGSFVPDPIDVTDTYTDD